MGTERLFCVEAISHFTAHDECCCSHVQTAAQFIPLETCLGVVRLQQEILPHSSLHARSYTILVYRV
jgi:hypothetical protein